MKPYFLGNWKMNKTRAETLAFAKSFLKLCEGQGDVGIAPSYTAISAAREGFPKDCGVLVGSQSIHWLESGAHTGEISASMLQELSVDFAIIGHSERRQFYGETDDTVSNRTEASLAASITPVVCVGESEAQFKAEETQNVVKSQLQGSLAGIKIKDAKDLVIAYEPVWAIGTGLAATPEIAEGVHSFIRGLLNERFGDELGSQIRILYGGSTKPENIEELINQPNINGALVGGASLKPDVFSELVRLGREAG